MSDVRGCTHTLNKVKGVGTLPPTKPNGDDMTDHRDTKPYRDLLGAHTQIERVLIALTKPASGLARSMEELARKQDRNMYHVLGDELRSAMKRIADHVPCKYEGTARYLCDCPDCDPDPNEEN